LGLGNMLGGAPRNGNGNGNGKANGGPKINLI